MQTMLYSFIVSGLEHRNMPAFDVDLGVDSGHGGRTRDMDGDELDGWDEGGAVYIYISPLLTERT
jgi:hypothetical protein